VPVPALGEGASWDAAVETLTWQTRGGALHLQVITPKKQTIDQVLAREDLVALAESAMAARTVK